MNDRQFLWSLSNGASVLAIAGFFWSGVCGAAIAKWGWWGAWSIVATLQVGVSVGLLWAAVRLCRRSGFVSSDFSQADQRQRETARRVLKAFGCVVLVQASAIALAVWWCLRVGAHNLVFPVIGLVTSLHFVPLARLFHVRAYYVTGLAGVVLWLPALAGPMDTFRLAGFEGGMAAVMWLSGWYVIRQADKITARAMQESWTG